jgi:glucan phosphoethanolaminetransferase (alkaline phosphatase superfamily)
MIFFKRFRITDLFLTLFFSLFLVITYNSKTIYDFFKNEPFNFLYFFYLVVDYTTIYIVCCAFLLLLNFNKVLLKTFLVITTFLSTICFYTHQKFGIIIDESVIANLMTSIGHCGDVTDYSLFLYFLFLFLIPSFFIIRCKIIRSNFLSKIVVFISCLTLLLTTILFLPKDHIVSSLNKLSPISYFSSSYKYFSRFHRSLEIVKKRKDLSYKFIYQKKVSNLNVILVIGESLRADHLSINGYRRETTPTLNKTKNLIKFIIPAGFNTTSKSVTSILSHRTKKEFLEIPPEKSIVSVFKNLGFKTHWYSSQSSKEFGNSMLNVMAMESDSYFFRDKLRSESSGNHKIYDTDLLLPLKKIINDQNNRNNFIILHSFGSHMRFHDRYPEKYAVFKPECKKIASSCKRAHLINSYDNSILFTDYFLSEIIRLVQDTNSILIFVSDHGQFLGEKGVYANGNPDQINVKQHEVPMFFYMTDKILQNNFYKNKFISVQNKVDSSSLSHDNIFDSLLDCAGIKSSLLNRNLSICK